jgi:carbon monoxide dehydrogenase subunit G
MDSLVAATVLIQAPPAAIREVLLDAQGLAEWNPAFLEVAPASDGTEAEHLRPVHPIRVRGGLAGTFRYTRVDAQRIESTWQVRGLSETNYWILRPDADATVVEHGFRHRGVLAAALRGAFADVADLRVSRLKLRVESAS